MITHLLRAGSSRLSSAPTVPSWALLGRRELWLPSCALPCVTAHPASLQPRYPGYLSLRSAAQRASRGCPRTAPPARVTCAGSWVKFWHCWEAGGIPCLAQSPAQGLMRVKPTKYTVSGVIARYQQRAGRKGRTHWHGYGTLGGGSNTALLVWDPRERSQV